MKIFVRVKPKAKEEKVIKVSDKNFKISVKEPPEKERANRAVLKALADYFATSQSNIKIISGSTSKQKIIEIKKKPEK